jgi:uncharacterized protein YifN (PemK superfamily)
LSFEEFAKYPAIAMAFCFVVLVVYWGKVLPSLVAKAVIVIQNNTNVMEMLVKSVDNHDKNVTVELKGQSKKLAVLDQQQQAIKTHVIGIQTDVQEIKSTMVTKQELSQVQDTVSKIYGRSREF